MTQCDSGITSFSATIKRLRAVLASYTGRMTDSASPMVDLDLRLVGYFVVVAEHSHFGRAATVLRR